MQFLNLVAQDVLKRFGNDLSEVVMVFPNIRSSIFFDQYIAQNSDKPLFSPKYEDLNTLFSNASNLETADNLMLLSILYNIYVKHYHKETQEVEIETFDEFMFFGEILLNDFDDIDKYLVDASLLYSNMFDLEELNDDFDHLTDEQIAVLNRFFVDIKTNRTRLKENFLSVWSILGNVYDDFKRELKSKGLAYSGMICRDVIENISNTINSYRKKSYVFVGFNVLTRCEEALMEALKDKSLFYWDYDDYFLHNQTSEAGRFMRKNIKKFPQATLFDTNNISKQKSITILSATTEVSQVGYIPTFITSLQKQEWQSPDTAIVFCNEQMLLPSLRFIPQSVDKVNVTMGFPLNQTPIYDLVIRLLTLQQKGIKEGKFYYPYLISVIDHYYTSLTFGDMAEVKKSINDKKLFYISPEDINLSIFRVVDNANQMVDYLLDTIQQIGIATKSVETDFARANLLNEAIFRVFSLLNRLRDLMQQGYLDIKLTTLISLIKRLLSSESVPFHGEPAIGLQMMGMLETRNLDFKNLIILSLNEGIMPKVDMRASFIPHFLRRSLGMSCLEHQDSIFAYYFYRLLQRAENITLLYNTSSSATSKSEMSRFLMQMLTEFPNRQTIKRITLQSNVATRIEQDIVIEKTPEIVAFLMEKFSLSGNGKILSPSAINAYLDCPLKFYLHYVKELREPDEFTDELDNRILGDIIHKTLEYIYRQIGKITPLDNKEQSGFVPFEVSKAQINDYIEHQGKIESLLELAFANKYFNRPTDKSDYNGKQLIYLDVAKNFILNTLRFDLENAPFRVEAMETFLKTEIKLSEGFSVNIGGYSDRIRLKNNTLWIDDYKISSQIQTSPDLPTLFNAEPKPKPNKKRASYIFQSFCYAYVMSRQQANRTIVPLLLYMPKLKHNEIPYITIRGERILDFKPLIDEFEALLKNTVSDIFASNKPFTATPSNNVCSRCDFKNICGR
ncbi:MAG: PD-(D/E)XK nuclease family protein [Porphyromonadaceae bacterium]|nr:PD-(D/E)XK nuclease family protein [Porphyromonadaceae bacterium]